MVTVPLNVAGTTILYRAPSDVVPVQVCTGVAPSQVGPVAAALAGDATTSVASNATVETSANARDLNDVILIS
jgi:hypothetical protein